jgi:hypothetical protein
MVQALIVAAHGGEYAKVWHYVKAGGGSSRSSICGKRIASAKHGWVAGKGGLSSCDVCVATAKRKYRIETT